MTIAAYLVDFDGTLADTSQANFLAYGRALAEVGVSLSREQFDRDVFGRNWRQFLPPLLAEQSAHVDPADVARRKGELYKDTAEHIRFNDALIHLLSHRGPSVQAALVTSASRANVQSALSARPDLLALFDFSVTGDDVARHKPDPECFHVAARQLKVAPAHCLVFEDSDIGVQAGRAFGAPVLRVLF